MSEQSWEESARGILRSYYIGFQGTQWHEFNKTTELKFLRIKIAYAMFGPPKKACVNLEDAYEEDERNKAQEIMDKIVTTYKQSDALELRVGFVFIACKKDDKNAFPVPIFSVNVGDDVNEFDLRNFIDTQGRVYKDWDDWKNYNCMPKLEYAYPKHGFFSCSGDNSYAFDHTRDPDIEFGESPASSVGAAILTWTDVGTTALTIGSGIIGIVSLFTPVAPVVLTTAAVTGTGSAVYGAGRGIGHLIDKGAHGQSLSDLESLTTWFSIIATPLHFASSAVTGTLAVGAKQGRIFSSSVRMFATVVNCMTLGLDSVLFGVGLINLIKKAQNEELSPLDVLQFSMSTFFFTNSLMQPRVASSVIRNAQQMHFDTMADSMTDPSTKQAFDNFMRDNKVDGSITDRSKIVRTINRMDDPNKFFKSTGPETRVLLGGRKGKTVIVSDAHGYSQRVKPNEFQGMFTKKSGSPGEGTFNFNKGYIELKSCYNRNPEDVQLNGANIFQDLTDLQKRNISRTMRGKNHPDIIKTSHQIAEKMGYTSSDDLMSVIEIVSKNVEGKSGSDLSNALNQIKSGPGQQQFIDGIQNDLKKATQCASKAGLKFENELKAVYHYRKHGEDFAKHIQKMGDTIEVYLGPVTNDVFDPSNLRCSCTLENGNVRHFYTTESDYFGIVTSTPDGASISTIYQKPGAHAEYTNRVADTFKHHVFQLSPEPVSHLAMNFVSKFGINQFNVDLIKDGVKTRIDLNDELSQNLNDHIARTIEALTMD